MNYNSLECTRFEKQENTSMQKHDIQRCKLAVLTEWLTKFSLYFNAFMPSISKEGFIGSALNFPGLQGRCP